MYKDETTGRNRREFRRVQKDVLKSIPAIRGLDSASKISQMMYGVKTMTAFIEMHEHARKHVLEFFDGDVSSMVAWSRTRAANPESWYYSCPLQAKVENRKTYFALVKRFGVDCVAQWANKRDFSDLCRAYEYLNADKKRRARLDAIIAGWDKWPVSARGIILHDYGMQAMQRAERAATRKPVDPNAPVEITFPQPVTLPVSPDPRYSVLVARNETDLRRIGRSQRHCVGTAHMGYADHVRRGSIWIVCVYQKTFGDGVCYEISRRHMVEQSDYSNVILQAQGRHRRSPTREENLVIFSAIKQLQGVYK